MSGRLEPDAGQAFEGSVAFYCVTDTHHFVGAVALLNSLRLAGHREPFVVLDCGLEDAQREQLAAHATIVSDRSGLPPMLLKAAAPLMRPAGVMAILDADVLVTRNLSPLLNAAAAGRIVAFANDNSDRFFEEWAALGLGQPRRQPYVASGHLFVSGQRGVAFLELFHEAQQRIDLRETLLANDELTVRSTPADAFHYPDMDVLNAVLATAIDADRLIAVDHALAPHAPFRNVTLEDSMTPRCRNADGTEPFVLHHVLRKPWLAPTKSNVYSRLLTRVLLGPDVELRLRPNELPLRLRTGRRALVDRLRADVQAAAHAHLRGRLGLRPRLAAWRGAHRAESPDPARAA